MEIRTLTIVGVGLIGGSVALAARRRGAVARIVGVGRDAVSLRKACDRGILDDFTTDLADAARSADLMIFCTPVDVLAEQILAAAQVCRRGTILTDAGSTKAAVVAAVERGLPAGVAFVGGHPLAGSHRQGADHADAELFAGRIVVLTPTLASDAGAVTLVEEFWRSLGARVLRMDPEAHDRALALTSHLPHLLAAALAGALPPEWANLTATGFRDTTRVASGDPALWGAICDANRDAILDALRRFTAPFNRIQAALRAGDRAALEALLQQAKTVRDSLVP